MYFKIQQCSKAMLAFSLSVVKGFCDLRKLIEMCKTEFFSLLNIF